MPAIDSEFSNAIALELPMRGDDDISRPELWEGG